MGPCMSNSDLTCVVLKDVIYRYHSASGFSRLDACNGHTANREPGTAHILWGLALQQHKALRHLSALQRTLARSHQAL